MDKVKLVLRILFGLALLVFGLNKFFNFMPPPELPESGVAFFTALADTGYMLPFIGGTEVLVGLLLISGFFVPLALVIMAPVSLHILAFHVFLAPAGMVPAIIVGGLNLGLMFLYYGSYRPLLSPKPAA